MGAASTGSAPTGGSTTSTTTGYPVFLVLFLFVVAFTGLHRAPGNALTVEISEELTEASIEAEVAVADREAK